MSFLLGIWDTERRIHAHNFKKLVKINKIFLHNIWFWFKTLNCSIEDIISLNCNNLLKASKRSSNFYWFPQSFIFEFFMDIEYFSKIIFQIYKQLDKEKPTKNPVIWFWGSCRVWLLKMDLKTLICSQWKGSGGWRGTTIFNLIFLKFVN